MRARPGMSQSEVYLVCTQYLVMPSDFVRINVELEIYVLVPAAAARLRTGRMVLKKLNIPQRQSVSLQRLGYVHHHHHHPWVICPAVESKTPPAVPSSSSPDAHQMLS